MRKFKILYTFITVCKGILNAVGPIHPPLLAELFGRVVFARAAAFLLGGSGFLP